MKKRVSLRERLAAGPVRGLGCANEVAREALRAPVMLTELVQAIEDSREVVSRRAANAIRKVQAEKPEWMAPFASRLVRVAFDCEDLHTRWNLTIIVGGLSLKPRERRLAVELMFEALTSNSGFLRTFAMQGLANFAQQDESLRPRVKTVVEHALEDSSAAMRARARRLLKGL